LKRNSFFSEQSLELCALSVAALDSGEISEEAALVRVLLNAFDVGRADSSAATSPLLQSNKAIHNVRHCGLHAVVRFGLLFATVFLRHLTAKALSLSLLNRAIPTGLAVCIFQ